LPMLCDQKLPALIFLKKDLFQMLGLVKL
jgi:hypothetical protein